MVRKIQLKELSHHNFKSAAFLEKNYGAKAPLAGSVALFAVTDQRLFAFELGNLEVKESTLDGKEFKFSVAPNTVKISILKRSDQGSNLQRSSIRQDTYEILNLKATLDGIGNQMSLLQSFEYSGAEMQKNSDGTVSGDKYGTDTTHIKHYGTITLEFKVEPNSKDWIQRVKSQYEGSIGGAKPSGAIELFETVRGWHIERYELPFLDHSKQLRLTPVTCDSPYKIYLNCSNN